MRTTHEVGKLQIFQQVGCDFHDFVAMGGAVVHVVVENGPVVAGIFQEAGHLRANHRIAAEEGTEHHHIAGMDVGIHKFKSVVLVVFIKDIFSIVSVVEEGQRNGRVGIGKNVHIVGIHSVFAQEVDDVFAHPVVACLGNEGAVNARPAERNQGIESRTSRHSLDGFAVFEDDVEHRFAYSYYFSHIRLMFSIVSFLFVKVCSQMAECSLSYAKIVQKSAMRTCSQMAECSLSYAKIGLFG